MSWRDNLLPASFRGVAFEVEAVELSTGRRVSVHQFPQKDDPYPEDMGRKAREYPVTGFVVGDDYMAQRDALLKALEQEGAGELVHPSYGTMQVVSIDTREREDFIKEGRVARFDITFVEAGKLVFPTSTISTGENVKASSAKVMSTISSLFAKRYSVDSLPDWARRVAGDDVANALSSARGLVAQADSSGSWLSQFDEKAEEAAVQTSSSSALSETVTSAVTKSDSATGSDTLGAVTRWAASGEQGIAAPTETSGTDAVSKRVDQNKAAVRDLVRGGLLAQGAASLADMDVTVYDDAMAARKAITRAIDDEMLLTTSDEAYQAWSDLRAKVHSDLTERAKNAARLKEIVLPQTTSSLVVAYDLYEDAGRDNEIVARNAIRHPSFVPCEPVKVLSV